MPSRGTIHGTHHLTFCVGGAQEDYDFHVRTLGLKSVKKTVLFDGEIPIYHLYYANGVGRREHDPHGVPLPPGRAGWAGAARTSGRRSTSRSRPPRSASGPTAWRAAAIETEEAERFGTQRLEFAHPCGIPYKIVGETRDDDREPYGGGDVAAEHAIRGAYGTTTSVREPEPMDDFLREAFNAEQARLRRRAPPVQARTGDGHGQILELVEEPDLPQGTWTSARARSTTTPSTSARPRTSCAQGLHRRPRLHRRLRRQGPRLLLLRLLPHAGRRAVRARLLDAAGLHDRRGRGRARHAHVHPAALGGPPRARSRSWSRSTRDEKVVGVPGA